MKKKIKIVAVVATLLIAAAGVITFEACNKKNAEIQPTGNRTPIAMRDASGNIVNLVTIDEFQDRFNKTAARDENIVIESFRITEPTADRPYMLTVDYIDVNEETSYSVALIGDYVEEIMNYLYITDDLKSGNFEVCTRKVDQSKAVVKYTNGVVEINENPTPEMLPPSWCVRCEKQYCASGSCTPSGGHGDYFCSDCQPAVPGGCSGCQPRCIAHYYQPDGWWGMLWRIVSSL